MTTVLVLSIVFVLLNGVFVAAEFALVAAPRPTIERRAAQGDRGSRKVLAVIGNPIGQDRYIATAQLGITLASLGLGMYGEHALAHLIEPHIGAISRTGAATTATVLSLLVLTTAHIVVGEMVPKGLALQHPEGVVRFAIGPMRVVLLLLYPFVALSNSLARFCLRIMGIRRQANVHENVYTPEELQLIVEESEKGGAIGGESGRIVRELLEFGDLTAAQAMVPRVHVVGVPVGATAQEIRRIAVEHGRTRYAVYEGDLDHVIGILHARDLLRVLLHGGRIEAVDARPIPVVPESASLDDVLALLQREHAQMAIVIDEHGGTAGIISLEDLFEEVVGDLDESTSSLPDLQPQGDGSVLAAGTVRLDELGQHFDLDLEHEEVESVSGLILAELGRPPAVGDVVTYERLRLEVTGVSGRGVQEARVALMSVDAAEEAEDE